MSHNAKKNAIKHGLSSLCHMPDGRENELPPIESDLIKSRQPETPEQFEIIRELAFAMWQRGEADRHWVTEFSAGSVDAKALYEKQAEARFLELREKWLVDPATWYEAFSSTLAGARFLRKVWTDFHDSLGDRNLGPSLQRTLLALKAMGFSTSPHMISGDGEWFLRMSLALKPDPARTVAEWLEVENAQTSTDAIDRAAALAKSVPTPGEALTALRSWATDHIRFCEQDIEELKKIDEIEFDEFQQAHQGRLEFTPEQQANLQRMHRYRTAAENRVKDCNRRLANIKAEMERKARHAESMEEKRKSRELQEAKSKQNSQVAQNKPKVMTTDMHDESETTYYRMPDNWRLHQAILLRVSPNANMFHFWSDLQLENSAEFLAHLHLNAQDAQWLAQVQSFLVREIQLRQKLSEKAA